MDSSKSNARKKKKKSFTFTQFSPHLPSPSCEGMGILPVIPIPSVRSNLGFTRVHHYIGLRRSFADIQHLILTYFPTDY